MGISLTQDSVRASFASSRRQTVTLEGFRLAAVLVPLIFTPTGVELLFTKRTETVETHKGQVSFPGGVVDAGDRDIKATATREAMEEIGIREEDIEVVGFLDDLATPTGFIITPVVAFLRPAVALTPNWEEVAEVFHMPLDFFAAPEHGRHEMRNVMGKEREVWHYDTGTHSIWGATAAIVRSLLIVLRLIDPAGSGR
jgi:8-oxo-dGTP pyrophosphatase MutT (NUDIX family)